MLRSVASSLLLQDSDSRDRAQAPIAQSFVTPFRRDVPAFEQQSGLCGRDETVPLC